MNFIMLRLEGHLQAWGERSYWDERDTSAMPTKSGVVGLIACCMGFNRSSPEIAKIYDATSISIRIDDGGRIMRDYQIIQNTVTAEGKPNKNSVVSPRFYLVDASFLVAIGIEDNKLKGQIKDSLSNPFWTPYLGRKCCIPSVPIYCGHVEAENSVNALKDAKYPIRYYSELPNTIQLNIEGRSNEHNSYKKRDVYGVTRFFKYRYVYEDSLLTKDFPSINILKEVLDVSVSN